VQAAEAPSPRGNERKAESWGHARITQTARKPHLTKQLQRLDDCYFSQWLSEAFLDLARRSAPGTGI